MLTQDLKFLIEQTSRHVLKNTTIEEVPLLFWQSLKAALHVSMLVKEIPDLMKSLDESSILIKLGTKFGKPFQTEQLYN